MKRFLIVLGLVVTAGAAPATAHGAPPANDSRADAEVVSSLPFSTVVDVSEATAEPGETQFCWFSSQTVWYRYTPVETAALRASLAGSPVGSNNLSVYAGSPGSSFLGCGSFGSPVTFTALAGVTYYFQAGSLFGERGQLELGIEALPPPANDDFADAQEVPALPFQDTQDLIASDRESAEPTPSCGAGLARSIWYRYTAASTGSVSASWNAGFFPQPIAAYTGASLGSLREVGCRNFGSSVLTFRALAGETYYLQLSAPEFSCCGTQVTFSLREAPAPQPGFTYFPFDPSIFDDVSFVGQSSDPGGNAIVEELYDFGDGTQARGCCPGIVGDVDVVHRYASDGEYQVTVRVTTEDGRTASVSRPVRVSTHDVAIDRLAVPLNAIAGKTKAITVSVANRRYDERVLVELYVGSGPSFRFVGVAEQLVLARPSRSTAYTFNYTFTPADAAVGKVTFRAVATILDRRDALPVDNVAISTPTRVSG